MWSRSVYLLLSVFIFFPISLTACATAPVTQSGQVSQEAEESKPYPGSGETVDSEFVPSQPPQSNSYPGPSQDNAPVSTSTLVVVPTADKDTGVVTGQISFTGTDKPASLQTVYLGYKMLLTPGPDYTIGMTQQGSPHSVTDRQGSFAIGDVPPGNYLILIWSPMGASPVIDSNTGKEMEIVVKAGEVLDIGQVQANYLFK